MSDEQSTDEHDDEDGQGEQDGQKTVLLIGDGDLSEETARALEAGGARVIRLCEPDEDDVREALEAEDVDSVAVVEREDALVLRFALMVRAISDRHPAAADDLRSDDGRAGRARSCPTRA